jgi:hypothetical protein
MSGACHGSLLVSAYLFLRFRNLHDPGILRLEFGRSLSMQGVSRTSGFTRLASWKASLWTARYGSTKGCGGSPRPAPIRCRERVLYSCTIRRLSPGIGGFTQRILSPRIFETAAVRGGCSAVLRAVGPSQSCAPTYGYSISFNEITELSPEHYAERILKTVTPEQLGLAGVHTYNSTGSIELIDGRTPVALKQVRG